MKFRELTLIVSGTIKDGKHIKYGKPFSGDYTMQITVDQNIVCESDIAMDDDIFRTQEFLNDYFDDETKLFKKELKIELKFISKNKKNEIIICDTTLKLLPNDEQKLEEGDSDIFTFDNIIFRFTELFTIIRLSCQGYNGDNCENETKEDLTPDLDYGISICTDSKTCLFGDEECDNNSYCNNQGTCFDNSTDKQKYCSCNKGWVGPTCSSRECAFDEVEYYFGNIIFHNFIGDRDEFCEKKTKCENETYCSNNGACVQYGDFMFCLCNQTQFTGENCEKKCPNKCGDNQNCTESNNGTLYCYPSLTYLNELYTTISRQFDLKLHISKIVLVVLLVCICQEIIFSSNKRNKLFARNTSLAAIIKSQKARKKMINADYNRYSNARNST
ncbi:LOW QUALITY PROTEIN: hypothetical protein HZS_4050 [Henneguya salminicola]|nr:LOW QUALITY PROTEIN: hypothetical protein HZS_4050 [Henneguya salminicola]